MDVPDRMHGTEKVAVGGLESVSESERVLCAVFGLELYSGNYNDHKKLAGSAGKDCNRSGGQLFYQRYEDL